MNRKTTEALVHWVLPFAAGTLAGLILAGFVLSVMDIIF